MLLKPEISASLMSLLALKQRLYLFKNFDQKKFKEDLAQAPCSIIESFDNPSDALDTWYNFYNSVVDLHVPRRVKRVKSLINVTEMDG